MFHELSNRSPQDPMQHLCSCKNRTTMGRAMRWLKKLLTSRKEGDRSHQENHAASACDGSAVMENKRWSFVKQRKSGVDGGKRPSASAAAAAELSQVRPCHCGEEEEVRRREGEKAAVMIQKAFRGYLARKALRALRSLVKLQALVRGYLVRKQAATTLRRLQALMRLQASSSALKKASYGRSMEQERIMVQELRIKPVAPPGHRRGLSDSTDSNYERSPRIVEMDTCHLRSRSSRMTTRYSPDSSDRLPAALPLSCSPHHIKHPPRLSIRRCHEHDSRHAKTAQNTPRLGAPPSYDSPAKSVDGLMRRLSHWDASPHYMADTASSVAKIRWQSAPRQRHSALAAAGPVEPRPSLTRSGSRKSCSQLQEGFSFKCSEATRMESSEFSDETTRDYYLDRMW